MKKSFFGLRIPLLKAWDNSVITDPNSFVHKKYAGPSNSSRKATGEGAVCALKRLLGNGNEALFGVHIKEALFQFRTLFSNSR